MGAKPAHVRFRERTETGPIPDFNPSLGPCLIHTGADNGNGYVQFRYQGKNGYAHRYAWESVNGPIPEGLTVDHLCRVRRCCRVEHLELVTGVENYLRGVATRTHCRNGHEYNETNTRFLEDNKRECKLCEKDCWSRASAKASAESGPDLRFKYDPALKAELVKRVVAGSKTVRDAAKELGCSLKYMDKIVRNERRSRSG